MGPSTNFLKTCTTDTMSRVAREPGLSGDDQVIGANDWFTLRDAVQAGKVKAVSGSKSSEQQRDAGERIGINSHGNGDEAMRDARATHDRQPPAIRLIEHALKTAGWSRSQAKRDALPMWRYEKENHV